MSRPNQWGQSVSPVPYAPPPNPSQPRSPNGIGQFAWPIALVVVAFLVPWDRILPEKPSNPTDDTRPAPVSGTDELRGVAEQGNKAERKALADFLGAVADQFARLDSLDASVATAFISDAETYRLKGTDLVKPFPGFGAARNKLLKDRLGKESRILSKTELAELASLFTQMASVVRG